MVLVDCSGAERLKPRHPQGNRIATGNGEDPALGGGSLLFRERRFINLHGGAAAHQVLISVDVISPGNCGPELALRFHEWLRIRKGGGEEKVQTAILCMFSWEQAL